MWEDLNSAILKSLESICRWFSWLSNDFSSLILQAPNTEENQNRVMAYDCTITLIQYQIALFCLYLVVCRENNVLFLKILTKE